MIFEMYLQRDELLVSRGTENMRERDG